MSGHFSGKRCPDCGAELLTDGKWLWCSYIPCRYGMVEPVTVEEYTAAIAARKEKEAQA